MNQPSDLVKIKTYYDKMEAEIAKGKLEAHNIYCHIHADSAGGMEPHLNMSIGIDIIVKYSDAETALSILEDIEA